MDTKDSKNVFMVSMGVCGVGTVAATIWTYLYMKAAGIQVDAAFAAIANICIGGVIGWVGSLGKEWLASDKPSKAP